MRAWVEVYALRMWPGHLVCGGVFCRGGREVVGGGGGLPPGLAFM